MKKCILLGTGLVLLVVFILSFTGAQESRTDDFDLGACRLDREQVEGTIDFHGHFCPGLTIGIRASEWCLQNLGSGKDGSVSTVVETDKCGTDAVQFLTGCTFGKGNFVHKNYGKAVYCFYRKGGEKGFRLYLNPALTADLSEEQAELDPQDKEGMALIRQKMIRRMFDAPLEEMFFISETSDPFVKRSGTKETNGCDQCGEAVEVDHFQTDAAGRRLCGECCSKAVAKQNGDEEK